MEQTERLKTQSFSFPLSCLEHHEIRPPPFERDGVTIRVRDSPPPAGDTEKTVTRSTLITPAANKATPLPEFVEGSSCSVTSGDHDIEEVNRLGDHHVEEVDRSGDHNIGEVDRLGDPNVKEVDRLGDPNIKEVDRLLQEEDEDTLSVVNEERASQE